MSGAPPPHPHASHGAHHSALTQRVAAEAEQQRRAWQAAQAAHSSSSDEPEEPEEGSRKRRAQSSHRQRLYQHEQPSKTNASHSNAAFSTNSRAQDGDLLLEQSMQADEDAMQSRPLHPPSRQPTSHAHSSASGSAMDARSSHPDCSSLPSGAASSSGPHEYAVLTLGIETADESMCPVIPRGTRLPCTSTQLFSTYADQQPGVSILIFQGQRASTRDNQFLGRLDLLGIRPAPRGVPRIEVTFTLNAHGFLRVTAQETLHGSVQQLQVQQQFEPPVKAWQLAQVDAILRDAELHRADDERLTARNATKSRFEQYIYGLRTSLEQHTWRSMLSAEEATLIHTQHEACIRWLHEHDHAAVTQEQFETKLQQVQQICQPVVVKMYAAAANQAPSITSSPGDSVMASVAQSPPHTATAAAAASAILASPPPHFLAPPAASASGLSGRTSPVALDPPSPARSLRANTHSSPADGLGYSHGNGNGRDRSGSGAPSSSYSGAGRLASLSATSSSPLISSMAPPSLWGSGQLAQTFTHPSLLTSPILASASYHTQSSDYFGSSHASAAGQQVPHLHEAYLDFLTFPNSATLSLTNVNVTDSEHPVMASGDSDASLSASVSPPTQFDFERNTFSGASVRELGAARVRDQHEIDMRLRGGGANEPRDQDDSRPTP